ncbi:MAG TPA: rhomboid family intramembrane serine protease [Candidatus Angelobacter sp.]|nr:rhomboid family intramembrane serine protease [Candidatus Angelobacter sp.]
MPNCVKCGNPVPVNEEGIAPVYCDNCANIAVSRASRGIRTGAMSDFPVTTALLAINLAVYIGTLFTGGSLLASGPSSLFRLMVNYGPWTMGGEYWRLVTAGFLHIDILHISFNMWCLWSLGQLSERLFGRWATAAIYLLTGVGGSLLSIAHNAQTGEAGASGAIFGIAGAVLVGVQFGHFSISSGERSSIISRMIFFIGMNLFLGFSGGFGFGAFSNIDNMCHLGGLISGAIIGLPLATSLSQSHAANRTIQGLTLAITALLMAVGGQQLAQRNAALGLGPRQESQEVKAASRALRNGDFPTAIRILTPYNDAHPEDAQGFALLGFSYDASNQPEKAIEAYKKALALEPEYTNVRIRLEELQKDAPAEAKPQ